MSSVAVIVLNYKGIHDTLACIESLTNQTYKGLHLVVVENGSHDGSAEKLWPLESEQITIICNDKNLGFAGGVNTGIKWAMSNNFDSVALFNNDAIADPLWLESLVKAQKGHKAGIVTALLLHEDGKTIDSTGEWYSKWGLPFPRNRGDKADEAPGEGFVFGATGGSSLYSLRMLRQIGLFDEVFFAYYEDVDVSFRAQLAGWKVVYTPRAIAYHKQGATSKKTPGLALRNTFKNLPLLFIKNTPTGLFIPVGVRFLLAYVMMFVKAIINGHGKHVLVGWLYGLLYTPRALWQRYNIQRTKRVSTPYIKNLLWQDLPPDQAGLRKLRKLFTGK